jgi:hypothetical protein
VPDRSEDASNDHDSDDAEELNAIAADLERQAAKLRAMARGPAYHGKPGGG